MLPTGIFIESQIALKKISQQNFSGLEIFPACGFLWKALGTFPLRGVELSDVNIEHLT